MHSAVRMINRQLPRHCESHRWNATSSSRRCIPAIAFYCGSASYIMVQLIRGGAAVACALYIVIPFITLSDRANNSPTRIHSISLSRARPGMDDLRSVSVHHTDYSPQPAAASAAAGSLILEPESAVRARGADGAATTIPSRSRACTQSCACTKTHELRVATHAINLIYPRVSDLCSPL